MDSIKHETYILKSVYYHGFDNCIKNILDFSENAEDAIENYPNEINYLKQQISQINKNAKLLAKVFEINKEENK